MSPSQQNNEFTAISEVLLRAPLWGLLTLYEIMVGRHLVTVPPDEHYYYYAIAAAAFAIVAMLPFGRRGFVIDMAEMSFYDLLVQILGLCLFLANISTKPYVYFAVTIYYWRFLRFCWPGRSVAAGLFAPWPVFGVVTWLLARKARKGADCEQWWKIALGFLVCAVIAAGHIHFYSKYSLYVITVPPILILLFLTRPLLNRLDAHNQARIAAIQQAEHARAEAEIADAQLKNQAELEAAHRNLHAAYTARDAIAKELALRNDRMSDQAHEVKIALLTLAARAAAIEHRSPAVIDDARWMQTELVRVGDMVSGLILGARLASDAAVDSITTDFTVEAMCKYMKDRFIAAGRSKKISFRAKPFGRQAIRLHGNEDMLKRILAGLVTNALEYAGAGCDVRVVFFASRNRCVIWVYDSGIGMAGLRDPDRSENFTALLDRLVEKQRAQGADGVPQFMASLGHGTGIGLLGIDRMCRKLGIQVTLRTEPGRGTVFKLYLPPAWWVPPLG